MSQESRLDALLLPLGRLCIYIEDGTFSVARVSAVETSEERMRAVLEAVPEAPLVCHFREDPPRFAEEVRPPDDRWEVSRRWEWSYPGEDVWYGSPMMGFRIVFAPGVVERFLARDLSWVEDYF